MGPWIADDGSGLDALHARLAPILRSVLERFARYLSEQNFCFGS